MARKAITKGVIRTLFARTGNQCAFPGCYHPLIDEDDDFVAQICHIEAASLGGPRFNPAMTDEERRSPENLLILCHRHHVKVDNADLYSVNTLKKLKADYEAKWAQRPFDVPDEAIEEIIEEESKYWQNVATINRNWLAEFDLAMPLQVSSDPMDYVLAVRDDLKYINKFLDDLNKFCSDLPEEIIVFMKKIGDSASNFQKLPYYENPFYNIFWEYFNIELPNINNNIDNNLLLMEVYILYQRARERPNDRELRVRLEKRKTVLLERAAHAGMVD